MIEHRKSRAAPCRPTWARLEECLVMTTPVYMLKGGRVVDPANGRDETADLWLAGGKVLARDPGVTPDEVIDAGGKLVLPGLVDMHVHLREPGREDEETIASGTRAAAAGGFTSVCAMPNTAPVIDAQAGVKFILSRAQSDAVVNVFPYAALTRERKGAELTEFGDLLEAGAIGFTDEGRSIMNNLVMHRALAYARSFDALILDHCEDVNLAEHGVARFGELATRLGLPGWPSVAESIQVARDVDLAEFTGGRVHILHVSSRASVGFIRQAQSRGVKVSAEVTPHHLTLTVDALADYDTNYLVSPPLGTEDDRQALVEGLLDGTIDVITSDHEPHTNIEKDEMFNDAPAGVIGMETAFSAIYGGLVATGQVPLGRLVEAMTINPSRLLDLGKGTLSDGADADVTVVDPELQWTVDPSRFYSKSRNCPWNGQTLTGRPVMTFVGGRLACRDGRMLV
jgi:dihydroorotase